MQKADSGIEFAYYSSMFERKMAYAVKSIVKKTMNAVDLGLHLVRGVDYQTLSQYILRINKHKEINDILYEVSQCLKDILDYELFGFMLKNGNTLDIWVDPRAYTTPFKEYIMQEFKGQNIDCIMHNFERKTADKGHISDAINMERLTSYSVADTTHSARLYILPRKKMLSHHDTIIDTIISSISIALEKNMSIQRLENAAVLDPLTNCYNRRALSTFIENDIAYAQRCKNDMSVIMIDMDNFKKINDEHGHLAGDVLLKEISTLIPALVRKSDYLVRFGGEEFVLVLPDTSLNHAVHLADKLRKKIEGHQFDLGDKIIRATASFGVASLENKPDGNSLLREADERLYQAKSMGKNTVVPSLLPCFADRRFVSKEAISKSADVAHVS